MSTYDGFRKDGGPTLYGPAKTSVTSDVLEAGLIFSAVILAFSLLIVLPGIRGRERWFALARILIGIFFTITILLVNFGQEWEVSSLSTRTQYRAGLREEVEADIEVKIGLRSINITLKTDPREHSFDDGRVNETIDYNERFHWDNLGFTQGRFGFGPFAGTFNQEFRYAQFKGLPYPILWIAEYFTLDGEGVRWGRHYRQAGYYTHIVIWTAFPLWILSMILFYMVLRYGGYFMIMTGGCLLMGNILYANIRNAFELVIPFRDGVLEFHWGWCFWLCLFDGMVLVLLGVVVCIMDLRYNELLTTFFGVDVALEFEEYYLDTPEDVTTSQPRKGYQGNGAAENAENGVEYEDVDIEEEPQRQPMYRRRHGFGDTRVTRALLRTQKKKPRPAPRQKRETLDPGELYENMDHSSGPHVSFHRDASDSDVNIAVQNRRR